MFVYRHGEGVAAGELRGRPVLSLPRDGRLALDADVLDVWTRADGRTLSDLLEGRPGGDADFIRAALACLAGARVLDRCGSTEPEARASAAPARGPAVTAVVITHTTEWLDGCLRSLVTQEYSPLDVIVVDNHSRDDVPGWVAARFPAVRVIRLPAGRTFAHAVNTGVAASAAEYVAILNPDIEVEPGAVAEWVHAAEAVPDAAAVAAKLVFWWAPAFLNGIGNRVDDRSWGTDNFIGHLDLGQFDQLVEVPSVCFAAALVRRQAWESVGPADEAFPLYYEDAEWSYRARLLGHRLVAAPHAVVRHVFGYKVRGGGESDLTPRKLAMAAYGRLRFALKLLSGPTRRRFVRHYLAEDRGNLRACARAGQWAAVGAYVHAWRRILTQLPAIRREHRRLRDLARRRDEDLFAMQHGMPGGLLWSGVPDLSRAVIERHYLPLLKSGAIIRPEF